MIGPRSGVIGRGCWPGSRGSGELSARDGRGGTFSM